MSNVRLQIYYGKLADRAQPPAPLRRFIHQDDWERLVQSVERALVLDMQFQYAGIILIVGCVLSALLLISIEFGDGLKTNSNYGGEADDLSVSPLPVIFFMFLLFGMALAQQCCIRPKVVSDVNEVLAEFSTLYPGISFHLMGNGNSKYPFFIQVYTDGHQYHCNPDGTIVTVQDYNNSLLNSTNLGNASANIGLGSVNMGLSSANFGLGSANFGLSSANIGLSSVNISVRLEELEKVRPLLSEQEYEEKRKSIIEVI